MNFSAAPNPECAECYIEAATSSGTSETAAGMTIIPLGLSKQANVKVTAIIISAYSITSAYLSDEVCITTSGEPILLTDAHTITSPTRIPSSDFEAYVASEFSDYIGFSACAGELSKVNATPVVTVEPVTSVSLPTTANSTASLLPAPSASLPATAVSTTSRTPDSSNVTNPIVTPPLDKPTKIGIVIGISLAVILLISLVAVVRGKRRFRLAAITTEEQRSIQDKHEVKSANRGDGQPYLQHKPELEAEEQQRHELEAWQKIYELDDQTGIFEIPAGTHEHRLAVMRTRQELRGGEHGQELDS